MLYVLIGLLSVGSILIATIIYAACVVAARAAEAGVGHDHAFLRRVDQKHRHQA